MCVCYNNLVVALYGSFCCRDISKGHLTTQILLKSIRNRLKVVETEIEWKMLSTA